jgi:hypothetical protein
MLDDQPEYNNRDDKENGQRNKRRDIFSFVFRKIEHKLNQKRRHFSSSLK